VPPKIVLKVGFLERDFGGKKQPDKNGPKNTLCRVRKLNEKQFRHGPFFENIFFEKFEKSCPFFKKFEKYLPFFEIFEKFSKKIYFTN
jgi:hypothetical protein